MEYLAPPLKHLITIKMSVENGESVRMAVEKILKHPWRDDFYYLLQEFMIHWDQGMDVYPLIAKIKSPYQRAIMNVVCHGFKGETVLNQLHELEDEIVRACEIDIEKHIQRLPIITLLPLMLLQFPAFIILFIGPVLAEFVSGFN